jgi:hypothetical protein
MLILIFPDEAEGFSGIISENIKNGRHIFEGCIKYPALDSDNCYEEMSRILQLSDETELIDDTIINIEERLPVVNKMDDYAELMQQFKDMNFLDFINKFLSLRKQYPDYLILSSYISQNKNSISKSSGSIKEFYNKLIYNIYGAVSTETFIEFQNTIKNKDEYIAKLEKEFKQKDEFINNLNSEINLLKGKLSESETKIDEILNPPINAKADEQLAFDCPEGIENIIITSFSTDRVFDAIGSYYLVDPQRIDILEKITHLKPGFPIVLHGASSVPQEFVNLCNQYGGDIPGAQGVPEGMLRQAASMGVCKINIDTDLRLAMTTAIRKHLGENPKDFDPRLYLSPAREGIKQMVKHKIVEVLGSAGKA